MSDLNVYWLSDEQPTPEEHLAFALDRQRERLLDAASAALGKLSSEQLLEVIKLADAE